VALQGNLEPLLLLAPWEVLEPRAAQIVAEGRKLSGHVFNLGHGIIPEVPPDTVTRLVARIHELGARG